MKRGIWTGLHKPQLHLGVNKSVCNPIQMFGKSKSPESLLPTSDALKLHIERAYFQANVWKQANGVKPVLLSPVTMGWSMDGDRLITTSYDT